MSLIAVAGPPGAGKSSVAASLARMLDPSVLVTGDQFFAFLGRGLVPPWLPGSEEQNTAVTRAAAAAAGVFADAGYETVFDGVLGPWFLPRFAQATGLASFDYVVLLPPEATCVERVATRSDHDFTDEDGTRHMHRQFVTAAVELDPRHLIDEPLGVDELAELILERRALGHLVHHVKPKPRTGR
jgi:cytidylate kinase